MTSEAAACKIATRWTTGPLVLQVLDKFQDKPFTCEYKYDGERAQVHILEGELSAHINIELQRTAT